MKRLALVLVFSGLAITAAVAGSNLSPCLDPATKLDAGGDVTDEEITAHHKPGAAAAIRVGQEHPSQD